MTKQNYIIGILGLVALTLMVWAANAEKRAHWPTAARELARAIDHANELDARLQRLVEAKTICDYATAARWAEQERYAAAEGMAYPLVEVGSFRVTAYLVPRDGGPVDCGGLPLHHGVIATDPAVIPTGALVYIPALIEYDRLYAPVYRMPLDDLENGILVEEEMGGGVEDGCVVSYEARGGGWWVARDTGAKVHGNVLDVTCFDEEAYNYIAKNLGEKMVKVYRMKYANEWMKTGKEGGGIYD